jgi:hypothetical protein
MEHIMNQEQFGQFWTQLKAPLKAKWEKITDLENGREPRDKASNGRGRALSLKGRFDFASAPKQAQFAGSTHAINFQKYLRPAIRRTILNKIVQVPFCLASEHDEYPLTDVIRLGEVPWP